MSGTVLISDFMEHLQENGLVIAPLSLVENRLQELKQEKLRQSLKSEKAVTYKQISDAELWGAISQKAVKSYAKKYAKPGEIFPVKRGLRCVDKIIISAVERLAKKRGELWD